MRVFMLGWEFPPFIAGGLGTACQGLTKSLARLGHDILFVLPRSVGDATSEHVRLVGPDTLLGQIRRHESVTVRRRVPAPSGAAGSAAAPSFEPALPAGPDGPLGRPAVTPEPDGATAPEWTPPPLPAAERLVGHPAKSPGSLATLAARRAGEGDAVRAGSVVVRELQATLRSPYPSHALLGRLQEALREIEGRPPASLSSYVEQLASEPLPARRSEAGQPSGSAEPALGAPPPIAWAGSSVAPGHAGDAAGGGAGGSAVDAAALHPGGAAVSAPGEVEIAEEQIVTVTADGLAHLVPDLEALAAGEHGYGGDLMREIHRYAALAVGLGMREEFDVIHAHDWLAYPAGLALKAATGKPLVVHVHATEFDRSGEHVNQAVYDTERAGMHGADLVICVSELTKRIAVARYGVPEEKVHVVYNGVEQEGVQPGLAQRIQREDKIVLFLGRITSQKGPEYFIRAAKRVLEKYENVKFVVAGSGDMAVRMIEQAKGLGIGHKVLFTGFLKGRDVARIFRLADLYVMPSVSEPFGIAPLEAMAHDTPVIISKQSGVSEVVQHALKVDFWDVDEMANKIVAVLKYPPLSQTLRQHGPFELRRLTWDGAAEKTAEVYARAIGVFEEPAASDDRSVDRAAS